MNFSEVSNHGPNWQGEAAEPARQLLLIGEDHPNPFFLAPDNTTMLSFVAAQDVQRNFMGDANRAGDLQRGSDRRHVANCAINAAAVELNRSGL